MMRSLPLHLRLTLGYTAFFAVVLVTLCAGVLIAVRLTLQRELEQHLTTSAGLIAQDFDTANARLSAFFDSPAFLLRALPPSVAGLESPGLFAEAIAPDGTVVATSASLEGRPMAITADDRTAALAGETRLTRADIQGIPTLLLVRPLRDDAQVRGVLVVGRSLSESERTLDEVALSLGVVGTVALLAAAQGGMWLTARALRPVEDVAQTAQQILSASDLSRRVPQASSHDALGRLTSTVNDLLARLERLFMIQQRFVADVSHELRTPLAAMRSSVEVLRRGAASDPQALDESLAGLEREAQRLGRLASDMLVLAQADIGMPIMRQPVALDDLVLEVVRELRPLAGQVRLIPEIAVQATIVGDRDRLKQALLNLLANALQHTPPHGAVQVALDLADETALVRVCDTGAGIAADDLPHIFDRFYRADSNRSRTTGGAGLGLAIVRWVAEAHGGQVTVESSLGEGSIFTLSLPHREAAGFG